MTLLVPRQSTVEEVVQALVKKQTNIPPEIYDRIRLFDARGHKEYREFQLAQALSTASMDSSYGANIFAEPTPLEEDEAGEHDRFIIVIHFAKEIPRLHGVPVKFVVKPVSPLDHCSVSDSSGNYGMIRRNDYRRDWDIRTKSLQRSNSISFQMHTTILKSFPSKRVSRFQETG